MLDFLSAEDGNRLMHLYSENCKPISELKYWSDKYGHSEGMRRLTHTLAVGVERHVDDWCGNDDKVVAFNVEIFETYIKKTCIWFEHIVISQQLLNTLKDSDNWSQSIPLCQQKIKQATDSEPQRVCSRSFRAGDIVWNCKQCQMDSTCVLCQQCFRDSDHEGHDVYFYHVMTDAGGCCDCGDSGAWDPKGFCKRHGEASVASRDPDPRKWLPSDVVQGGEIVIKQVIRLIGKIADCGRSELVVEPRIEKLLDPDIVVNREYISDINRLMDYVAYASPGRLCPREARDDMNIPILLKNWAKKMESCIATQQPGTLQEELEGFALTEITLANFQQCGKMVHDLSSLKFFHVSQKNISAVCKAQYVQHLTTWLLSTLCRDSDSFSRIACHSLTEGEYDETNTKDFEETIKAGCSLEPLKGLIVRDLQLPDSCAKSLRNLYIRLLVDGLFKKRFSVAFACRYRECCLARVDRLPILEMSDVDSVFGLSVQFLNRPKHVLSLVRDYGFLHSILESLHMTIQQAETRCAVVAFSNEKQFSLDKHHHHQDGKELDLLSTVMTHRKSKALVTDLTYVLSTPGMSRYLLTADPQYLTTWFNLLKLVYNLHEQYRIVEPMPPKADDRWIPAFNLSLSLLSLYSDFTKYLSFGDTIPKEFQVEEEEQIFKHDETNFSSFDNNNNDGDSPMYGCDDGDVVIGGGGGGGMVMMANEDSDMYDFQVETRDLKEKKHGEVCCKLLEICGTLTAEILERKLPSCESIINISSLLGEFPYIKYDITRQPVSFHCLLQRFFAMLHSLCISSTLDPKGYEMLHNKGGTQGFWLALMRHPLNALSLCAQKGAGMWLRNFNVSSQAMNYQSLPFISGMFMDIRVLQMAALNIDPDVFLHYIVYGFGMDKWFEISQTPFVEPPKSQSKHQEEQIAETLIELLCVLLTELPQVTPFALKRHLQSEDMSDSRILEESDKLLRREIVHCLAIKRCTFSMISDTCTHLRQLGIQINASNIRKVLKTVSQEITRADGMGPIQYDLKPTSWSEFDPLFHRLARNEKDQARERWVQYRVADSIEKPCFPGDTKPKSASTRKAPLPATCWHSNIHPLFHRVRKSILLSKTMFTILRNSLNRVCKMTHKQQQQTNMEDDKKDEEKVYHTTRVPPPREHVHHPEEPGFHSVLFLANVLHLLTIQIYFVKEFGVHDDNNMEEQTTTTNMMDEMDEQHDEHHYSWETDRKSCLPKSCKVSIPWFVEQILDNKNNQRSIMDDLISLWYNDPQIDVTNRESVRWLLAELCNMDQLCLQAIRKTYKSKKTALQAEKAKLNRKKKAQRNAMKAMQKSQAQALLAFGSEMNQNDDDDEEEDEDFESGASSSNISSSKQSTKLDNNNNNNNSNTTVDGGDILMPNQPILRAPTFGSDGDTASTTSGGDELTQGGIGLMTSQAWIQASNAERKTWKGPECVSCHERHRLDEGPTCYIGFRQRNDVLIRKQDETTRRGWCVYWAEESGRNYVVQLCGHAIHAKCLDHYRKSIQALPINAMETDEDEFLCPLCKTLSNFEVPCVPPGIVRPLSNREKPILEDVEQLQDQQIMGDKLDDCCLHLGNVRMKSSAEEEQIDELVKIASNHLDPMKKSLKKMMVVNDPNDNSGVPFEGKFDYHSEFNRRRELQTMVIMHRSMDNKRGGEGDEPDDRLSILSSVALTFVAERGAVCHSNKTDPTINVKSLKKMKRMFDACRAYLLIDNGMGRKRLLAELSVTFSQKRSISHHTILHQSPELLLILSILAQFNDQEKICLMIRSMYILKLTQTLLELSMDDVPILESSKDFVFTEQSKAMFDGAFNLRNRLLDKFEQLEISGKRNTPVSLQHENKRLLPIMESILDFLHVVQIVLTLCNKSSPHEELKLVGLHDMVDLMQIKLQLPSPKEIMQHPKMMDILLEWIDQSLVCMPKWIPRSLTSLLASTSSSAVKVPYENLENSNVGADNFNHLLGLRPLSIRPLVKLRFPYTEQYVEVHKGICQECKEPAHDKAICLICGEILFAGKNHPGMTSNMARNNDKGQCTRHIEEYHNGIGMVLLFRRSSSVLLVNRACSAYWGSLYVDKNGDDQQVIPSLPMFLDGIRYSKIEKLWAENAIPSQVSSLRQLANVVIRRNYY